MPRGIPNKPKAVTVTKGQQPGLSEYTFKTFGRDEVDYLPDLPVRLNDFTPFFAKLMAFPSERVVTQMLENNVATLDSLRRTLEHERRKDIPDVRQFGEGWANSLLTGFEDEISYSGLVDIIDHMKAGIANRRVALEAA